MGEIAFTVPILPGQKSALEEFARMLAGPKKRETEDSNRRLHLTKELWFLESSPHGDRVLFFAEGEDLANSFAKLAASRDPFDVWIKEQVKGFSGLDFNQPATSGFPKLLFRYP